MSKILMISLDKSILNPSSPAAERMRGLGEDGVLLILIPEDVKLSVQLSESVRAFGTGGGKPIQFFRLVRMGIHLLREHGIDEITTQDPFFTGLAGLLIRSRLIGRQAGKKIPLEVQLHGDFFSARGGPAFGAGLARFVIRRADRIRVVGERVRQSVLRMGIPEEKITVRPIAVHQEAIREALPRVNLHQTYPQFEQVFLTLSRFDPVKNLPWLVGVFADIVKDRPRTGLIIVGSGADEQRIRDAIRMHGLEQSVLLEPWTDRPWDYIKTTDAVLIPSVSEGYGLVAMEAHALGTPVIMTDVGVANYELKPEPGKVTILPVGDAEAFKQAILSLSV